MILVALGGNLPGPDGAPPEETGARAAAAIGRLPGLTPVALSPWYRTAPVPPSGQPDYVNAVLRLSGQAEPETLLAALHGLEAEAGRERGEANAARTLDLDLIELDGLVRPDIPPILPHPRAHLRPFVLVPLLDVAPDWRHPTLGKGATELLRGFDAGDVRRLTRT